MNNTTQKELFCNSIPSTTQKNGQARETLGRIDADPALRQKLLNYCRLSVGQIWRDPEKGHRIGVLDATNNEHLARIIEDDRPSLVVNDPPYNVTVGNTKTDSLSKIGLTSYMTFSRQWVENCIRILGDNAHFYIWLGADVNDNFQPLPDFMIMMREFSQVKPRNFITMRNQRGYGTQKNWMWVRQELLHYIHGDPDFTVQYTDIPKILRGYYKKINGRLTENIERSKSDKIRPGNVWIDVQQVFYRLEENVPGCYAQKPLKAIERLLLSSSKQGDCVLDCFSHSGTTLIAGERHGMRVVTFDIDPVFAEITIRRLENYRKTGRTGWQWYSPFPEIEEIYDSASIA